MTANWNAIYCRPRCEEKVLQLLEKKGIVHYYPLNRVWQTGFKGGHWATVPLFPSMIFVQLGSTTELATVRQLSNVLNLVYWQDKPAFFPQVEIDLLSGFLKEYETAQLVKTTLNKTVKTGAQKEVKTVQAMDTVSHVIVLPSIGYSVLALETPLRNPRPRPQKQRRYNTADYLAIIFGFRPGSSR